MNLLIGTDTVELLSLSIQPNVLSIGLLLLVGLITVRWANGGGK